MAKLRKTTADAQVDTYAENQYHHRDSPYKIVDGAVNFSDKLDHIFLLPVKQNNRIIVIAK